MGARYNKAEQADAVTLARLVESVVKQNHPKKLGTIPMGRDHYQFRSTLYYPAEEMYPLPPLRDCVVEDTCPNCSEYRTWRARYEEWAIANGVEVLPEMLSPSRIAQDQLAPTPHVSDPMSAWVGFVAAMIQLARPQA